MQRLTQTAQSPRRSGWHCPLALLSWLDEFFFLE